MQTTKKRYHRNRIRLWRMMRALCLVGLMALVPFAPLQAGEDGVRTWTSVSGATLDARFAGYEDGQVMLERPDGTRLAIALRDLSAEDAAWVQEQTPATAAAPGLGTRDVATGPNKLPVFTSGPWTGYHAVYQHAHFDAAMDADGVVHIQLKNSGQPIGEPLRLHHASYYNAPQHTGRRIQAFHNPSQPVMQPSSITLEGKLEHDVPFDLTFEFNRNEVAAWGACQDPRDLRFPTRFRIILRIPPSHDIPAEASAVERIEKVKGYALHLRAVDGRRRWEEFNYHEAQTGLSQHISEARIEAPGWLPRVVSVSNPGRDVPLRPYVYSGRSLWQGYIFHWTKRNGDDRAPRDRIVLTVD